MITTSAIRDALRVWLENATSATVIYADQAGPRPTTPYVTLKLLLLASVGFEDYRAVDDNGIQDIKGDRVLTCSVNVYGETAFDLARDALNALNKETVQALLRVTGMAPARSISLDDLTQLEDTEWMARVHFDQEIVMLDEYTDDVGLIENVEVTERYESPNMVHTETYTITS